MKEEKEKIDYKKLIEKIRPEMENVLKNLQEELAKIRTGRASSALLEGLSVECFGQKFPLRQLGTLTVPEPQQVLIIPWDVSYIEAIVKAIERSNLGVSVNVEGNVVRVIFPPITEEFKQNILKILSQKKEEAKKKIRYLRQEVWDEIQEAFKEKKISEDEKYRGKKELQDLIENFNDKIEEAIKRKESEILS